jgi:hypothetical protein
MPDESAELKDAGSSSPDAPEKKDTEPGDKRHELRETPRATQDDDSCYAEEAISDDEGEMGGEEESLGIRPAGLPTPSRPIGSRNGGE